MVYKYFHSTVVKECKAIYILKTKGILNKYAIIYLLTIKFWFGLGHFSGLIWDTLCLKSLLIDLNLFNLLLGHVKVSFLKKFIIQIIPGAAYVSVPKTQLIYS